MSAARIVRWWARRNGMMIVPVSRFSPEVIRSIRKALKDDAAGNRDCTMTDLDLACDMLDELLQFYPPNASMSKTFRKTNYETGKHCGYE